MLCKMDFKFYSLWFQAKLGLTSMLPNWANQENRTKITNQKRKFGSKLLEVDPITYSNSVDKFLEALSVLTDDLGKSPVFKFHLNPKSRCADSVTRELISIYSNIKRLHEHTVPVVFYFTFLCFSLEILVNNPILFFGKKDENN